VSDILDAANDFDGPRAVEIVEHEVDEVRSGSSSEAAALVVVLLEEFFHPGAGVGRDVDSTVEDPRHRRHRDARLCGDGGNCYPGHPPSISDGHNESPLKVALHDTQAAPWIPGDPRLEIAWDRRYSTVTSATMRLDNPTARSGPISLMFTMCRDSLLDVESRS